jgi:hypothetical protein
MAEKLTIKKWFDEEDGLPERFADDGTHLGTYDQGYDICEDGTQVGCANDLDVAHLFAASPILHSALRESYAYIIEVARQFNAVPESDVTERIVAAIAAAEGE